MTHDTDLVLLVGTLAQEFLELALGSLQVLLEGHAFGVGLGILPDDSEVEVVGTRAREATVLHLLGHPEVASLKSLSNHAHALFLGEVITLRAVHGHGLSREQHPGELVTVHRWRLENSRSNVAVESVVDGLQVIVVLVVELGSHRHVRGLVVLKAEEVLAADQALVLTSVGLLDRVETLVQDGIVLLLGYHLAGSLIVARLVEHLEVLLVVLADHLVDVMIHSGASQVGHVPLPLSTESCVSHDSGGVVVLWVVLADELVVLGNSLSVVLTEIDLEYRTVRLARVPSQSLILVGLRLGVDEKVGHLLVRVEPVHVLGIANHDLASLVSEFLLGAFERSVVATGNEPGEVLVELLLEPVVRKRRGNPHIRVLHRVLVGPVDIAQPVVPLVVGNGKDNLWLVEAVALALVESLDLGQVVLHSLLKSILVDPLGVLLVEAASRLVETKILLGPDDGEDGAVTVLQ